MAKETKKVLTQSDITDAAADHLADMVFNILEDSRDEREYQTVFDKFIARVLALGIDTELRQPIIDGSVKEKGKVLRHRYAGLKARIGNSVATAFEAAMNRHTDDPVEYAVTIQVVKEMSEYTC